MNVIVIKYVTETLISLLFVVCDIRVSISYFDQILGKRESQTRQVFDFVILWFENSPRVQNLANMVKNRENDKI